MTTRSIAFIVKDQHPVAMTREDTVQHACQRMWKRRVGAVLVNFRLEDSYVEIEANVDTVDRTGVEMEAMTACAIAALTIYDMCKSIDRSMTIGDLTLWEKTGGRSGTYRRQSDESDPFAL